MICGASRTFLKVINNYNNSLSSLTQQCVEGKVEFGKIPDQHFLPQPTSGSWSIYVGCFGCGPWVGREGVGRGRGLWRKGWRECQWRDFLVQYIPSLSNKQWGFNKWLPWMCWEWLKSLYKELQSACVCVCVCVRIRWWLPTGFLSENWHLHWWHTI